MSQRSFLDQLLDGAKVEWKQLGDLTIDKFWIMPATPKFNENEEIPYITSKNIQGGNITFENTKFISHSDYLNLSRNRPILAGDILISMIGTIGEVARVKESDLDFYGQNMYLIRLNKNLINSDFFLHFFDSPRMKSHFHAVKNNSGQGYLKANNIEQLPIPIPPLPVQVEIVRILDAFTELTAELTARKKQYNYYRDQLLSFEEGEVEWKTLGETLVRTKGTNITAGQMKELDKFGAPLKVFAGGRTVAFVNFEDIPAKDVNREPSIIVKSRGVIEFEYYDKPFSHKNEMWSYHSKNDAVDIKFVYYFLRMNEPYFQNLGSKMQMPQIATPDTDKFQIPIPSLAEQERIVAILDKFDALTSSISEGLPREIELRQKQYEYYRELLLSFPKPDGTK
ncbi:type I restriction modification DNA specificity domain protein [Leptospira kirschneri str. JB]|uniref:restriction endonuclease subunit S n=1 Tax=Leptospira kirschneri TaxID=29507 RepID=UPI0002BFBA60|nr:restriction endonuclease subunit S [Leptospira kirschneri]EMJ94100.1 type I restriction modification DNA specificity domain protein [Leptospira kirschneri str. JB]